jgi:hypothetical protein
MMAHDDGEVTVSNSPADSAMRNLPDESLFIRKAARERGIRLAVAGSVAVHLLCPSWRQLLPGLGRRPMHDIDFWALAADEKKIEGLFDDLGYNVDPSISHMREWGIPRLIFEHAEHGTKVDVFLDKLVMAHTIPFQSRVLEFDHPAVTFTDLLLSKLQIHELTRNDLLDLFVMLGESSAGYSGSSPGQSIDEAYLQQTLGGNWGFWHDARENLAHVRDASDEFDPVPEGQRDQVRAAAIRWIDFLDSCKKSSAWKRRSWIGTKSRWYELVREVSD